MVLLLSKIKNFPVFTKSNLRLGNVVDVEIEVESQTILRYVVQRGQILGRLQEPLLVHRNQVVEITSEKIIVEDSLGKEEVKDKSERSSLYESIATNY